MPRLPVCACLVLVVLSSGGERLEAVYREDAELVFEETEAVSMKVDEALLSIDGVQVSGEVLKESGLELPSFQQETLVRFRDRVLGADEGRPTRVRRSFERLHRTTVESGEEKEKTGPLEGKALLLEERDGKVAAELDGKEGEKLDEVYLAGHRLTHLADLLLPTAEVSIGDSWQVEDAGLREFIGMGSGPLLFERSPEHDDAVEKLLEEDCEVSAEVEWVEDGQRSGVRCAVLAFTIDLEAAAYDPAILGGKLEGAQGVSGEIALQIQSRGRLWYAMEERRPVAMEQNLEGGLDCHFEMRIPVEEKRQQVEIQMTCSIGGKSASDWSPPE